MKVRKQEAQDILNALEDRRLGRVDAKMWKKKGWLHIQLVAYDQVFSLYRADKVKLVDGAFRSEVRYEVNREGSRECYDTWKEVLQEFQFWLHESTK